jgi:hypothetical protein
MEATNTDAETWVHWHTPVISGLSVCLGFFGLVNLASIAASHGFHWHSAITEVINGYRNTLFPIYDLVLGPVAILLRIHLTQTVKDLVTCILLALAAANTESVFRDRRPLAVSVFRSVRKMLEGLPSETTLEEPLRPADFGVVVKPEGGPRLSTNESNFLSRKIPRLDDVLAGVFFLGFFSAFGLLTFWVIKYQGISTVSSYATAHWPNWLIQSLKAWSLSSFAGILLSVFFNPSLPFTLSR